MQRSKFYQFFPPPQFLQMPTVGVDISDVTIRFVELVEKRKGFVVDAFGEHPIPRGVIELGEVKKPDALRAIFSTIKNDHNLEFVSVSLPEGKAYLFELRLPSMNYRDLRGAIELELEEHVPIKVKEALFDYDITSEDESTIEVVVSVVPRSLVDGYLEAFSGSGLTPVAFEVEPHSVSRSVIPQGDNGTFMIVDFGKTRSGITVVSGGFVQFTSTVAVGSGALTDAIVKSLKVSYEEAEKIKNENGILLENKNEELARTLQFSVAILRDEIIKHKIFWQEHTNDFGEKRPPIQKIYLCGGDAGLAGILEYLAMDHETPIELANTMINVNTLEDYIPEISFNESLRYATAIGLALRRPQ